MAFRSIRIFLLFLLLSVFITCLVFKHSTPIQETTQFVLQHMELDHPYKPILELDNQTNFLTPNVRNFLFKTRPVAFPKRYNAVFLDTLLEFDRIWRGQFGRSYMLYAGTLLGAIRHGDKTPWDDDLDLMVDIKYNATIRRDLNGSKFFVTRGGPFRKLFFTHNGTTVNKHGHWPFIDLFFYKLQKSGKEMVVIFDDPVYQTKQVFPPSEVAYMGLKFPSPRCPKTFSYKYIDDEKALTNCCKSRYNHRLDNLTRGLCIKCHELRSVFQFAKYRRINETHVQQHLSKPTQGVVQWTKGLVLRMPQC